MLFMFIAILLDRGIHLNDRDTDIIYSFSTSLLHPSSSFSTDAKRIIYMPVNKHIISSIRMYLTDKNNQLIRLNGAHTTLKHINKK